MLGQRSCQSSFCLSISSIFQFLRHRFICFSRVIAA